MEERCALVLEDGMVFYGTSFGAPALPIERLTPGLKPLEGVGEVVFNTGMVGYFEILTDPSYTGQIVTMTYPHIGNYGVDEAWCESGPEEGRRKVKAAGFVIRSLYDGPVPEGRMSLHEYLASQGIPGITGVDTRALTLRLRDGGSPFGVIVAVPHGREMLNDEERTRVVEYLTSIPHMEGANLIGYVGTHQVVDLEGRRPPHFAVIDCGIKANIIRELKARDVQVTLFPSSVGADELLTPEFDAVLFSNGPGDPAVLTEQIDLARSLIGKKPLFGVCLGHQIISLAFGAKTYKMKFGHHGINNPVRDEFTRRVFVTSQNHGFAVDEETLPDDLLVWFRNANDATVEGIAHRDLPVKASQFHPEAGPGPHDCSWIFDEFISTALRARKE
ncbi:carbamoyl-phosphate synthase, small subunit [Spirochaeta thermophila DSM 6578]|uniref:Carbamoyl phosphate synthase small chain n=1 Tax=Winmispira thermophila (strain ATCC 700085 / DSM 6578 / Z-1203) TaxID=869211 RepID=G0G9Z8_WINT7|nr:glutamine-hydrolyzing carbamoyl-phosphate synthase small subunit [Spirochaeta thermophila]AEJ61686.1 carbamoyl-phosphate synthase, small subunit [Spirochaeta thermophila DSM 6578]